MNIITHEIICSALENVIPLNKENYDGERWGGFANGN